ncbi:MAG TPA: hypothetical protein VHM25_01240 [Polyangiaceae bacterium]|jgi:hypothetical protein|nr:hypothetical protein [Polyangiaceae bacterium]
MGLSYEQAVSALYQAPFESFVTERKRLAGELKAEGDKAGAAQLAKLARPSISAWAVNQLWWHARDAFDELFETAAELRKGKLAANPAHRKALAKLGTRAQQLLSEAAHSANDATLRRVTMTLSGLAAAGSFEPDTPGALTKDRDPPGFEAFGIASSSAEEVAEERPTPTKRREPAADEPLQPADAPRRKREAEAEAAKHNREAEARAAEEKRRAEAEAAERKREAEAQAKRQARRKQLQGELADAKAELTERERERDRAAKQLATAEREVERARAAADAAQSALDAV